ncbi:MAG: hypothetical protein VX278_20345, partial [Myxococcota bacterium]|nr:hypothetical protein [Myxococcota bacterium]
IITKYLQNSENGCSLAIDGQSVFTNYDNGKRNVAEYANFSGTLVLPAGSVASSKNITPSSTHYCSYYLEGYYVH